MRFAFLNKLRFKIILSYFLILLACAILSGYMSARIAEKEFRNLIEIQLRSTMNVAENFMDLFGQTALIWAKDLSEDPALKAIVKTGNKPALQRHMEWLLKRTSADNIILVGGNGRVIASGSGINKPGDSLASRSIVKLALDKGRAGTSISDDKDTFFIYSSGVIDDGRGGVLGVLLIGYSLNNRLMDNLKKNTDFDVAIIRDRAVMASTLYDKDKRLSDLPLPYLEYQMLLKNKGHIINAVISDKEYLVAARDLVQLEENLSGSILLAHPLDGLAIIKDRLYKQYLLLFVAGFIIAIILWVRLSRRILRPIEELTAMTRRIAGGELKARIKLDSGDEFSELADQFNIMADYLDEHERRLDLYNQNLELEVKKRTEELENALVNLKESQARIKRLKGLIPICAKCKNIRDDLGYWKRIEEYVKENSEAEFTHGICPDCLDKFFVREAKE